MGLGFAAFSALFWKVCPLQRDHLTMLVSDSFAALQLCAWEPLCIIMIVVDHLPVTQNYIDSLYMKSLFRVEPARVSSCEAVLMRAVGMGS